MTLKPWTVLALPGLLILGWKVAGYYGLDRVLLPLLGTPWKQSGVVTQPQTHTPTVRPTGHSVVAV